jgi:hypothetical protein
MHPEIAKSLVAQHRDELVRDSQSARRAAGRRFPRWHVSWTRTVLAPAGASGSAGPAGASGSAGPAGANRAGRVGPRGSSLVIIISAHRSA